LYTHLDGFHSLVPVGQFKIGLIAAERLPHLSNAVIGDPRVSDQEWAKREGMVSFAGYPLLIEGRVVGVMAVFARHLLPTMTLDTMRAAAKAIALGIDHKQIERERERLLLATQHAREQAEDALEARNAFLSSVSHDLKTPLTSIKGNAQMLQLRVKRGTLSLPQDIARLQQGLETIETSVKKMRTMIDDLLDLAQLQAGQKLDFETSEVNFVMLVQRVVQEQQSTTTKHQLLFQTSVSELFVSIDETRLERVVGNLLNNAIKYSPVGGAITISLSHEHGETSDWAVLALQDEGIGIPAADLPHIFEPFRRADNSKGKIQGTGVGLTSAAQIIEQHAGTITVESEEGVGTLFTIRIPLLARA
jgi:signal transduction histidine kinase